MHATTNIDIHRHMHIDRALVKEEGGTSTLGERGTMESALGSVHRFQCAVKEIWREKNDEVEQGKEQDDPELQFKGPMTRLRAKKLQAYLQASIHRKFELHEEEMKSSPRWITMLSIDDDEGSMKNTWEKCYPEKLDVRVRVFTTRVRRFSQSFYLSLPPIPLPTMTSAANTAVHLRVQPPSNSYQAVPSSPCSCSSFLSHVSSGGRGSIRCVIYMSFIFRIMKRGTNPESTTPPPKEPRSPNTPGDQSYSSEPQWDAKYQYEALVKHFERQNRLLRDELGNQVAELQEEPTRLRTQLTASQTVQEEPESRGTPRGRPLSSGMFKGRPLSLSLKKTMITGTIPMQPVVMKLTTYHKGEETAMIDPEVLIGVHIMIIMKMERRHRNHNPPIDTWEEMNELMRDHFIPIYYERELKKKLNRIKQGSEVELRDFTSVERIVQYTSIVEKQLREGRRCSHYNAAPRRPSWNKASRRPESTPPNQSRPTPTRPNQGVTAPNAASNRVCDIQCHKCQGWGHFQAQCPNRRVLYLTESNEVESASEDEKEPVDDSPPEQEVDNDASHEDVDPEVQQQRMQERFKEENAKQAAAKRTSKATAAVPKVEQPIAVATTPPKPSHSNSLDVEKENGSSSNKPHVKSLFISMKGVQKAVKADDEFDDEESENSRMNSFQQGGMMRSSKAKNKMIRSCNSKVRRFSQSFYLSPLPIPLPTMTSATNTAVRRYVQPPSKSYQVVPSSPCSCSSFLVSFVLF
ncbi:hypothetical protein C2S52_020854 [Perilla frutescens var. hirtella]|nr:hypothetical protein C2S52_020854 [Perilla frutescens var. hirtella]